MKFFPGTTIPKYQKAKGGKIREPVARDIQGAES